MNSLLVSKQCNDNVILIIGDSVINYSRINELLKLGAKIILITPKIEYNYNNILSFSQTNESKEKKFTWLEREFQESDLTTLGRNEVENIVDMVFVTLSANNYQSITISNLCKKLRIPINVTDSVSLSTFSLLASYNNYPLQIGVTTNGSGCRLASRIKREIISSLPSNIALGCKVVGEIRKNIRKIDEESQNITLDDHTEIPNDEDAIQPSSFNKLDKNLISNENEEKNQKTNTFHQRLRWLSQIVEYYPLSSFATLSINDLTESYSKSKLNLSNTNNKGKIILVGSGPGSPDLLTFGAMKAITSADIILVDKLVPTPILELIPKHTLIHIAKKFPGNAERAQNELLELGLDSLNNGKTVVRLKQGDPYIYGRGGEEFLFFSSKGFNPIVIPGITSALAAPLMAKIPLTMRDVSDQVLICTGTGRKGALPDFPDYIPTRTTIFLMALHRIHDVVDIGLIEKKKWPSDTPCAVIERATCNDQRVIRTTLKFVADAINANGSLPPGLLVVGNACNSLNLNVDPKEKWTIETGYTFL